MDNTTKRERGLFVGHRTYAPRESWLYKGMEAVVKAMQAPGKRNPFLHPDAAERFGVGSSMVASARFWVQMTGLISEQEEGSQRVATLTPFGSAVWKHDRYLEHAATLCWMHYYVVCDKTRAPSWYWLHHHGPTFFTVADCLSSLWHWAVSTFAEQEIRQEALQRDIACLLRMYVPRSPARSPEDLTYSPFARLQMIIREEKAQEVCYRRVPPKDLHPLVPLALLLDQQGRNEGKPLLLQDALYQPMSVGRSFLLSGSQLLDLLAQISEWYPERSVRIERAVDGRDRLVLPQGTFLDVVQRYYGQKTVISDDI
jgi:hypothetical protein